MEHLASDYNELHQKLLDDLEKEFKLTAAFTGINKLSDKVIHAIAAIKRHMFIDQKYEHLAYKNTPVPIKDNQTISQPFVVALMTELLDLQPQDRVLEIGTGSGYQTVVLSMLASEVYTIELFGDLFNDASQKFKQLNINNIYSLHGDGNYGWQEHALYNKIIITAAAKRISNELMDQLICNGTMVAPIGDSLNQQILYKINKTEDNIIVKKQIIPVRFVPFIHS